MSRRDRTAFEPARRRALLAIRLPLWRYLTLAEQARLEHLVVELIDRTAWEGVGGLEMSDEIRITVAGHACVLILGLDLDHYRDVTSVIVYPTTAIGRGERHLGGGIMTDSPVHLRGEARMHGPVMVTWDAVLEASRHPERGHNVVHHEFAHKLDMRDGSADGIPLTPERDRFARVSALAYHDLLSGREDLILDPYAATNRLEFFAVATEAFFSRPAEFLEAMPEFYDVLRFFYRQDPATRMIRSNTD